MSHLADALDSVVAALVSAGIDATTDPRNLNPPCAWVTVHDVAQVALCGEPIVRAAVALITGDRGAPISVGELGDLLDKALTVLALDEPARAATVTPPGQAPLPALVLVSTTE